MSYPIEKGLVAGIASADQASKAARGLFVFTAGNQIARSNLEIGIARPVSFERIAPCLSSDVRDHFEQLGAVRSLFCWGAMVGRDNTTKWHSMRTGDWVLCVYDKTYQYTASVVLKLDNEALARRLWGTHQSGQTWRLMYFLSQPHKINVPVAQLDQYLNAKFLGFTRIGKVRLQTLVREFGSVDAFVTRKLLGSDAEIANG